MYKYNIICPNSHYIYHLNQKRLWKSRQSAWLMDLFLNREERGMQKHLKGSKQIKNSKSRRKKQQQCQFFGKNTKYRCREVVCVYESDGDGKCLNWIRFGSWTTIIIHKYAAFVFYYFWLAGCIRKCIWGCVCDP